MPDGVIKVIQIRVEKLPAQGLSEHDISFLFGADAALFCPVGMIAMWSGLVADIPLAWALCDGQNGTPDLRDKFIKGVGTAENPGATGGAATHVHDDHAALQHAGAAVQDHAAKNTDAAGVGATQRGTTTSTLTLKAHVHNITAYAHSVTQPSDHAAQSHSEENNEPAFYKLAFIIKI
jgi:hypothetical protein